MVAIDIVERDD